MNFVVDTGAGRSVIDKNTAEKLNLLEIEGTGGKAGGLGSSKVNVHQVNLKSLKLDQFVLKNLKVYSIDLSHVNNTLSAAGANPKQGIIGADLLKKFKAKIDYEREVLIILSEEDHE